MMSSWRAEAEDDGATEETRRRISGCVLIQKTNEKLSAGESDRAGLTEPDRHLHTVLTLRYEVLVMQCPRLNPSCEPDPTIYWHVGAQADKPVTTVQHCVSTLVRVTSDV